jgi:hypothetical protein
VAIYGLVILQMWDLEPKCLADLKLPQIYNLFPYKFRQINFLIQICTEYINSAEQTCGRTLGDLAWKEQIKPERFKRVEKLRICNKQHSKNCGFAIFRNITTNLRTCTLRQFADLRKRNKPKNLHICDLWTKNRFGGLWLILTVTLFREYQYIKKYTHERSMSNLTSLCSHIVSTAAML